MPAATITPKAVAPTHSSHSFFPRYPFLFDSLDSRSPSLGTGLEQSAQGTIKAPPPSTPTYTFARCPRRHTKQVRAGGGGGDHEKSPAARTGRQYESGSPIMLLFCFFARARPPFVFLYLPSSRPPAGLSSTLAPERAARILRFLGFLFHSIKCFYDPLSCRLYSTVPLLSFISISFTSVIGPDVVMSPHPPSPHLIMPPFILYVCASLTDRSTLRPRPVNLVSLTDTSKS